MRSHHVHNESDFSAPTSLPPRTCNHEALLHPSSCFPWKIHYAWHSLCVKIFFFIIFKSDKPSNLMYIKHDSFSFHNYFLNYVTCLTIFFFPNPISFFKKIIPFNFIFNCMFFNKISLYVNSIFFQYFNQTFFKKNHYYEIYLFK